MGGVNNNSPPAVKIALFMSLFRGREDLYAQRFESLKTGKSGYAPVCSNEWARGLCEKPKVACAACRNRKFLPATPKVIGQYLTVKDASGRPFVLGVYPLLPDECCAWVAADNATRTGCCRSRGAWCSGSWRRMSASASTRFLMSFSGP